MQKMALLFLPSIDGSQFPEGQRTAGGGALCQGFAVAVQTVKGVPSCKWSAPLNSRAFPRPALLKFLIASR